MAGNALKIELEALQGQPKTRQAVFAETSCRLLVEKYAPAALLINRSHQILYSQGAIGEYLSLSAGTQTSDVLTLAPPVLRGRLRTAIQNVFRDRVPVSILGGDMLLGGAMLPYRVDIIPVPDHSEPLQLICFVALQASPRLRGMLGSRQPIPEAAVLEQEIQAVRAELHGKLRDAEISNNAQRAIDEEAVGANEEYQSTIAELDGWKSGLEILAREMTELNGELRLSLETQETNLNTLRGILHSIGVAILLLDADLNIRFFTPEIAPFFHLIATDIGRPLGDLNYLAADGLLTSDSLKVLHGLTSLDREIEMPNGSWVLRRIAPYRTVTGENDGLVVTFNETIRPDTVQTTPLAATNGSEYGSEDAGFLRSRPQMALPVGPNVTQAGPDFARMIGQTASALSFMLHNMRESPQAGPDSALEANGFTTGQPLSQREGSKQKVAGLTSRERQIMKMVVAGQPSKTIAVHLGISQRTVENHRASIMRKTETKSLPALARLAFTSGLSDISETRDDIR